MSVLQAVGLNFFMRKFFLSIVVVMFPMILRKEVDIQIDRHPNGLHYLWSGRQSDRKECRQTDK